LPRSTPWGIFQSWSTSRGFRGRTKLKSIGVTLGGSGNGDAAVANVVPGYVDRDAFAADAFEDAADVDFASSDVCASWHGSAAALRPGDGQVWESRRLET